MPKRKTNKSIKRRFKVTGSGKVRSNRSGKRHLLGGKRRKIKRNLRRPIILVRGDAKHIKALIAG